jgi:predicted aspartyl protease
MPNASHLAASFEKLQSINCMIRGTLTNDKPIIDVIVQDPVTLNTWTVQALLDTGCTGTVISEDLATQMQLQGQGMRPVTVGSGASSLSESYKLIISLPGHKKTAQLVCGSIPARLGGCDVVIGIELMKLGRFTLDRTKFTLLIPSLK